MSEERSLSSSAKPRMDHGGGVDVGVGANSQGGVSLRAGATLMKSVSIFLMSGRKASVTSKRQTSGSPKHEPRRRQRRRMPVTGSTRSSAYVVKLIESLKRKTRFSWQKHENFFQRGVHLSPEPVKPECEILTELDNLCKLYKKLTNPRQQQVGQSVIIGRRPPSNQHVEGIDRTIFRELLHNTFKVITEDTLVERIFCCWDRENEGIIRLEPWIMGLDLYLRGSLREKIEFCFKVYDLNNDGFITKDEIFQLFKNCLMKQPGEEDPDEAVKDLSELALKKLDVDRNGKISFQDYKLAVLEEPLLLEAFGQCLPTDENCAAILTTLQS
ncbi:CLXN [Anthophora retusa]